jgi:hypothetical protein
MLVRKKYRRKSNHLLSHTDRASDSVDLPEKIQIPQPLRRRICSPEKFCSIFKVVTLTNSDKTGTRYIRAALEWIDHNALFMKALAS